MSTTVLARNAGDDTCIRDYQSFIKHTLCFERAFAKSSVTFECRYEAADRVRPTAILDIGHATMPAAVTFADDTIESDMHARKRLC